MSTKSAEKCCPCIVNKDLSRKAKAKDSGHKAKAKAKDLTCKAKAKAKDLTCKAKAKAKDLTCKAKAKAKDLKKCPRPRPRTLYLVLKDHQGPRPRTNITGSSCRL